MSILGYSAAYFLPEYWANTPFYGEKIIPLLDYMLSTDFVQADKLATAFYMIEDKYKNTADLPLDAIEAVIEESGYTYVKDLLGNDEESIRLLVYLLVLIHQLKGTKAGIELVLSLLKKDTAALVMGTVGSPTISTNRDVSGFTVNDYILYSGFSTDEKPFDLTIQFRTPTAFSDNSCIASSDVYGFYIGINDKGNLVLSLGNDRSSWNILNSKSSSLTLSANTSYYVKLNYSGYGYTLSVSTDNKKYTEWIEYTTTEALNLHGSNIYLGIDKATGTEQFPFAGSINLTPFATAVSGITLTEWFNQYPVGSENTFIAKADLDIDLISTDFFQNFSNFVKRYVYPTLEAFEVRLALQSKVTFIPWVRQRVTYVALGDLRPRSYFITSEDEDFEVHDYLGSDTFIPFTVLDEVNK